MVTVSTLTVMAQIVTVHVKIEHITLECCKGKMQWKAQLIIPSNSYIHKIYEINILGPVAVTGPSIYFFLLFLRKNIFFYQLFAFAK